MTAMLFLLGCVLAALVFAAMLYGLYHLLAAGLDVLAALCGMFSSARRE